jgi:GTP diphosphokinase / guanosine-3',5'-bis(diphosphate) 3'-diphosphatase
MDEQVFFTPGEHKQLIALYKRLLQLSGDTLQKNDCCNLKKHLVKVMSAGSIPRNAFGMNPIIKDMQTAVIVAEEIGMRRASILGIMLHESVKYNLCTLESVKQMYGEDVAGIIHGLVKIVFFFLYCYKLDGFFILLRWIQFVNEYLSLKFITIC